MTNKHVRFLRIFYLLFIFVVVIVTSFNSESSCELFIPRVGLPPSDTLFLHQHGFDCLFEFLTFNYLHFAIFELSWEDEGFLTCSLIHTRDIVSTILYRTIFWRRGVWSDIFVISLRNSNNHEWGTFFGFSVIFRSPWNSRQFHPIWHIPGIFWLGAIPPLVVKRFS